MIRRVPLLLEAEEDPIKEAEEEGEAEEEEEAVAVADFSILTPKLDSQFFGLPCLICFFFLRFSLRYEILDSFLTVQNEFFRIIIIIY